jgi:hypothetical protein
MRRKKKLWMTPEESSAPSPASVLTIPYSAWHRLCALHGTKREWKLRKRDVRLCFGVSQGQAYVRWHEFHCAMGADWMVADVPDQDPSFFQLRQEDIAALDQLRKKWCGSLLTIDVYGVLTSCLGQRRLDGARCQSLQFCLDRVEAASYAEYASQDTMALVCRTLSGLNAWFTAGAVVRNPMAAWHVPACEDGMRFWAVAASERNPDGNNPGPGEYNDLDQTLTLLQQAITVKALALEGDATVDDPLRQALSLMTNTQRQQLVKYYQ